MKYLSFYKKCMKTGYMPHKRGDGGLCEHFGKSLDLLGPEDDWDRNHKYWGADDIDWSDTYAKEIKSRFSPLRQNIVLFKAAMEGEL